ncbi:MAG TPA: gephyrin-like molybdotransferase receptor GlpR [Pseudonocardiaceae bacterium]|nr:gephyrin-like molybdotransferase receptor GlpR [Pseudonocardiaceae bacterium]
MPSSLIIVALVGAWLLVLVPIVARRRQEVARTADSTLAARVVRSGGVHGTAEREPTMPDTGEVDRAVDGPEYDDYDVESDYDADYDDYESDADYESDDDYEEYAQSEPRPFRPGRGGYDAEAAAMSARARYTFRQRIVVLTLLAAVVSALLAVMVSPLLWWVHAVVDIALVSYLGYLRRQVRIEEEIRDRRAARLAAQPRPAHRPVARPEHDAHGPADEDLLDEDVVEPEPEPVLPQRQPLTRHVHPGTVVVDTDDEDPVFAELEEPGALPYRRAVGE